MSSATSGNPGIPSQLFWPVSGIGVNGISRASLSHVTCPRRTASYCPMSSNAQVIGDGKVESAIGEDGGRVGD